MHECMIVLTTRWLSVRPAYAPQTDVKGLDYLLCRTPIIGEQRMAYSTGALKRNVYGGEKHKDSVEQEPRQFSLV